MPSPRAEGRGAAVDAAMTSLVLEGGFAAVTVRAVARRTGVAPSTLMAQFTDRTRLVRRFCVAVGYVRMHELSRRSVRDGLEGMLPTDESMLERTRVWLAIQELARTDEEVADAVDLRHEEERAMVRRAVRVAAPLHDGPTLEDDTDLLLALLTGLRAAVSTRAVGAGGTDPGPMTPDRAARLLRRYARLASLTSAS